MWFPLPLSNNLSPSDSLSNMYDIVYVCEPLAFLQVDYTFNVDGSRHVYFCCLHIHLCACVSSQVAKHLAKLFDSMAKLKFTDDASGKPTKEATAMYSKEGEFVTLATPLMCVGQVENWLSQLLENMQETIRREFVEAVVTYEEMPRDQWIFKPPAQVALAGTQIWWTTEVNLVFARLEEGYENALKDYYKKQASGQAIDQALSGVVYMCMYICICTTSTSTCRSMYLHVQLHL